jgi:hypothetical protein
MYSLSMNRCAKISSDRRENRVFDHVEKTFFVNSSGNLCCMGSGGIAVDVIGNAPNHPSTKSLIFVM